MFFYLDASCMARAVTLDGPLLWAWGRWVSAVSSEISRLEVARTLNRLRIERVFSEEQYGSARVAFETLARGITWLPITSSLLEMAGEPTPRHLKSLDALHLATARQVRSLAVPDLVFATHDDRLGMAARSVGFTVEGLPA